MALGYGDHKKGADYCYPWYRRNTTKSYKVTTDKKKLVTKLIDQVPEVLTDG